MSDYIDKQVVYDEIDKLSTGIFTKGIDEILSDICNMRNTIKHYRKPYQCNTCKDFPCSAYKIGCRDCNRWQ